MGGSVLVGLDGTVSCAPAVRWGAEEAAARGLPLHFLHSWASPPGTVPLSRDAAVQQRYGAEVLAAAEDAAHGWHPGIAVTGEQVSTQAVDALVDRGRGATLTVLGSRGHGAIAGFLLGSVSLHVLGRAECPVVTVREEEGTAVGALPEIVVGVQGAGQDDEPVLDFAFTAADAHGARLRAVHATAPEAAGLPPEERPTLADVLGPWRAKFPAVDVAEELRCGRVEPVLLAACTPSGLLVIGRRVQRSPMLLGPVVLAVLHHARCPVAVVPRR
ncbi:universal stress protein [Streptomyces sp. NPDC056411]|uniref:universal stress protein n=1 Tax=Streptomyces sp. NPDC056411 TaxID=3345813 RepID=UPI0035DE84C0